MIHLEHASLAGRAVMGSIRFTGLTFLAESFAAGRFDHHGRAQRDLIGREIAVTSLRRRKRRSRINEDGGRVGPA